MYQTNWASKSAQQTPRGVILPRWGANRPFCFAGPFVEAQKARCSCAAPAAPPPRSRTCAPLCAARALCGAKGQKKASSGQPLAQDRSRRGKRGCSAKSAMRKAAILSARHGGRWPSWRIPNRWGESGRKVGYWGKYCRGRNGWAPATCAQKGWPFCPCAPRSRLCGFPCAGLCRLLFRGFREVVAHFPRRKKAGFFQQIAHGFF